MHRHDLDQLLGQATERQEDGFTERVMRGLPPPRRRWTELKKQQAVVWAVAALGVLAILFSGQSGWIGGSLALSLVAFTVLFTHVEV